MVKIIRVFSKDDGAKDIDDVINSILLILLHEKEKAPLEKIEIV